MFFMYPCEMEIPGWHVFISLENYHYFVGNPNNQRNPRVFACSIYSFNHGDDLTIRTRRKSTGFANFRSFFHARLEKLQRSRARGSLAGWPRWCWWALEAPKWCRKMWDFSNEHPRMHHFHGKLEVLRYVSGCWFGTWILLSYFIYGILGCHPTFTPSFFKMVIHCTTNQV
jgi:hypothetical protein